MAPRRVRLPRSRAARIAAAAILLSLLASAVFWAHRYRTNAGLERLLRKGRFGGDVATTYDGGRVSDGLAVLSDTHYGPLPGIAERLKGTWRLLGEPTGIATAGPGCDLGELFARIDDLPSVEWVHLNACGTVGGELALAADHPGLRRLWLRGVHLSPEASRCLAGFQTVEDLNLEASTGIDDETLRRIATMPRLRRLALSSRGTVTDADMTPLAALRGLETLSLQNMAITDASVPTLIEIAPERRLDVWGTGLTPEGVARLRTALPGRAIKSGYDTTSE